MHLDARSGVSFFMRTIKLTIEYEGTNYAGWQVQPNGLSIQEVIETALTRLTGDVIRIRSSGRTDAGVHARGMVASFQTTKTMPVRAFSHGLNTVLPEDIAIRDAVEVSPGFNPRRDAVGKHYRYTILNTDRRSPLDRHVVWRLGGSLDVALMAEAAGHLIGEHDFSAFRAANCGAMTTVRRMDSITVARRGDYIVIDVLGSGFLKNMVRIIVGTLVAVGRGSLPVESIRSLLHSGNRNDAAATAPPQGLCLLEVFY